MIIEIKSQKYNLPTKTSEVSVKRYFEYLKIVETYKDWIDCIKNGDISVDDTEIYKEVSFMADMLVAITDIPKDILYNEISHLQIIKLSNLILSEQDQEKEPRFQNCFEFPDCTIEEVEELKQKIKNVKWYRIDKKIKLSYQLYQLQKPVLFLVAKELAEQTLSQWIVTEQFRANMLTAGKELKSGIYTNISKIIAHITRQPHEVYDEKIATRREKVFENLPLSLANQIANFFLLMFHELQKNMQTYSETEKMTTKEKMTTTQQKKK